MPRIPAVCWRVTPAYAEHLAAIGELAWIDRLAQPLHERDVRLAVHLRKKGPLLEADAVLACDRSAEANAQPQDVGGELLGAFERTRLAAVEQDQRVQGAVAGVKHVGDAKAVRRGELLDRG